MPVKTKPIDHLVTPPRIAAFWKHVDKSNRSGCWTWTSRLRNGYATVSCKHQGKKIHISASRFAYTAFVGPIPPDAFVLHRCDNPLCVRPKHLFTGSCKDNVADMIKKDRGNYANYSPPPRACTLTEKQVLEIRALHATGTMGHRKISQLYPVTREAIGGIVRRQTWKHLP